MYSITVKDFENIRENNKYLKKEFAQKIKMSQSSYSRLISTYLFRENKSKPLTLSLTHINNLTNAFPKDVAKLLTSVENPRAKDTDKKNIEIQKEIILNLNKQIKDKDKLEKQNHEDLIDSNDTIAKNVRQNHEDLIDSNNTIIKNARQNHEDLIDSNDTIIKNARQNHEDLIDSNDTIAKNIISQKVEKCFNNFHRHFKFYKNNGNRFYILFYKILQNIDEDISQNAKQYLMEQVNNIEDGSPFLEDVKKEIITKIKYFHDDDCLTIVNERKIFMKRIYYSFDEKTLKILSAKDNHSFFNFYHNLLRKVFKMNVQFDLQSVKAS